MIILRNILPTVCLTLMVAVSVSAAPAGALDAHTPSKNLLSFQPSSPVVKIDRSMTQERQTLPDGTISVETTFDAFSATTAKAMKSTASPVSRIKA